MGSWVHDTVHLKSLDFFEPCAKAAKQYVSNARLRENATALGKVAQQRMLIKVAVVVVRLAISYADHTDLMLWLCLCFANELMEHVRV